MDENMISENCTCGNPEEKSVALHSGTCPVWGIHHKLIIVEK